VQDRVGPDEHPVCSGGVSLPGDLLVEEGALGVVGGQGERLPVGGGRLAGPAEPAEQVRLDRWASGRRP